MRTTLLHRLSLFLVVLSVPAASLAAPAERIISASGRRPVTRGEFVQAAVTALGLSTQADVTLPYKKPVAKELLPYVRAAYKAKALDVLGAEFEASTPITRGEASVVLMKLGKFPAPKSGKTYADAPAGSELEAAARLAVERKWLRPLRSSMFGAAQPLAGADARAMIRNVAVGEAAESKKDSQVPVQVIQLKTKERPPLPDEEMLRVIWQIMQTQYLRREKLDEKEAAYAAAEALVESAGDPYSVFLRPQPAQEFETQLEGTVTGIGAQVEMKEGKLTVVTPLKGSPAEAARLQPGDIILSVNGEPLAGLGFLEAVSKVRGPKGSTAKLKIRRGEQEFDVDVVRDTVKLAEIEVTWKGRVAVVRLSQFGTTTDRELRSTLQEVQAKNPQGLVLDLRNNPGGLLHAADVTVSNFLPKGSVVANIDAHDGSYEEKTTDNPTIDAAVPLVVLINKGSASASEIVAGALQDAKRATVVGTQSFGKGTVQQVIEFRDGSGLKLTVAEWLTPKHRVIDGIGIAPDIEVQNDLNDPTADPQLQKALELVRS